MELVEVVSEDGVFILFLFLDEGSEILLKSDVVGFLVLFFFHLLDGGSASCIVSVDVFSIEINADRKSTRLNSSH